MRTENHWIAKLFKALLTYMSYILKRQSGYSIENGLEKSLLWCFYYILFLHSNEFTRELLSGSPPLKTEREVLTMTRNKISLLM